MRRFGQFFVSVFLFAIAANYAHAQTPPWSGIIDPNRAVDWSAGQVGVPGGIPSGSWTQCGSTVAAGTSVTTVNSLLAACPVNTYLLLGPGTFNFAGPLIFSNISNRVVRGSGASSTSIVFSSSGTCPVVGSTADVCIAGGDLNYNVTPSNTANWTAGYAKGTTTITLSSVSNLKVGFSIILDQFDDSANPSVSSNDDIFVCGNNAAVCTINGDNGDGHRNPNGPSIRAQQQNVTVTQCDGNSTFGHACSSGANIAISPGLYMPNWCKDGGSCSATQPGAWWPSQPIFNDGIENVSMDHSAETNQSAVGVLIFNCVGCWVSGVRSMKPGRSHVAPNFSPHTQIQNSYFWQTFAQASVSYGMDMNNSGDSLILNNIFEGISASIDVNGNCSGCVAAYNFSVNQWFTLGGSPPYGELAASAVHAEGNDTMLYEGNIWNLFDGDDTHGTHNMITEFRNVQDGFEQNGGTLPNNGLNALLTRSFNRFFNFVGNVFGNSYTQAYNYTGVNGVPIVQSMGGGAGVPDDAFSHTSSMLWANWDPISGTRYCGPGAPGYSNPPCSSTSEVPTAIPHWPNPTPASTTLPPSFLYRSEPSWWPATKPWPPIGPDVTGGNLLSCNGGTNGAANVVNSGQCSGGTTFAFGGHANSTPAMDCFLNTMGGSPIGTDTTARPFNPSVCYTQSVSNNPPPQPPTNLSATVN
jgi:hypothetical protein